MPKASRHTIPHDMILHGHSAVNVYGAIARLAFLMHGGCGGRGRMGRDAVIHLMINDIPYDDDTTLGLGLHVKIDAA